MHEAQRAHDRRRRTRRFRCHAPTGVCCSWPIGQNFKITGFARNLFDKKYLNEVIPAIEFGGSFISPGQRRQIGVEVGYKF